ncbi:hypothetical protein MAUB1S_09816 [Mycolicibacterium aubagnense]
MPKTGFVETDFARVSLVQSHADAPRKEFNSLLVEFAKSV